jgi:RimJ/RimL family protein N-acetyltransferase
LLLTVKKEYWERGIGQAMMAEFFRFAREHGDIKNVHLGVWAGNEAAIRIYEKFGFQKIGMHKTISV